MKSFKEFKEKKLPELREFTSSCNMYGGDYKLSEKGIRNTTLNEVEKRIKKSILREGTKDKNSNYYEKVEIFNDSKREDLQIIIRSYENELYKMW